MTERKQWNYVAHRIVEDELISGVYGASVIRNMTDIVPMLLPVDPKGYVNCSIEEIFNGLNICNQDRLELKEFFKVLIDIFNHVYSNTLRYTLRGDSEYALTEFIHHVIDDVNCLESIRSKDGSNRFSTYRGLNDDSLRFARRFLTYADSHVGSYRATVTDACAFVIVFASALERISSNAFYKYKLCNTDIYFIIYSTASFIYRILYIHDSLSTIPDCNDDYCYNCFEILTMGLKTEPSNMFLDVASSAIVKAYTDVISHKKAPRNFATYNCVDDNTALRESMVNCAKDICATPSQLNAVSEPKNIHQENNLDIKQDGKPKVE